MNNQVSLKLESKYVIKGIGRLLYFSILDGILNIDNLEKREHDYFGKISFGDKTFCLKYNDPTFHRDRKKIYNKGDSIIFITSFEDFPSFHKLYEYTLNF